MAPKNIAIIGAGVMGTSTAYYLSASKTRGSNTSITLVEAVDVASAASGKAGGFLALDWHGQATASGQDDWDACDRPATDRSD
jgi:glycine/D-amino acid oxidase-like deaminating enzyme